MCAEEPRVDEGGRQNRRLRLPAPSRRKKVQPAASLKKQDRQLLGTSRVALEAAETSLLESVTAFQNKVPKKVR